MFRKISKVVIFSVLPLSLFAETQESEDASAPKTDIQVPAKGGQVLLQSDEPIRVDENGRLVAKKNVLLQQGSSKIQADELYLNRDTQDAGLKGNIRINYSNFRLVSDGTVDATAKPKTFTAEGDFRIGNSTLLLTGSQMKGGEIFGDEQVYFFGKDEEEDSQYLFNLKDARAYFHEPDPYALNVRGSKMHFYTGSHATVSNATIWVGSVPVLWLPKMILPGKKFPILFRGEVGVESKLGGYWQTTTRYQFNDVFDAGTNFDFYTDRGFLFGPVANYSYRDEYQYIKGGIDTGYIHDYYGERGYDVLGERVGSHRGYASWHHKQITKDGITITGSVDYWSESEILRDFRQDTFDLDQQPISFVELNKAYDDIVLTAVSSFQINNFYQQTQRLPEIRADLLTTPVANLFYHRGNLSFAHLEEERPIDSDRHDLVQRLNLYYGAYKPFKISDFATFTPNIGGQVTRYGNTGREDNDTYTRFIGALGADLEAIAYQQWDVKNKTWNINGIRHIARPVVSYRYMPNADVGTKNFDKLDRYTETSRMPSIDLGSMRNIDDMHNLHVVRYGLRNVIETRSLNGKNPEDYDRRELASIDIFNDYYIQQFDSETRNSDLYTDVKVSPVAWLTFDFYNRYNFSDPQDKEFNGGMTIKNADLWNLRLGKLYHNENGDYYDQYTLDFFYRINDEVSFDLEWRYDNDKGKFTDQIYGLNFRVGYSWLITLQFAIDSDVKSDSFNKTETDYQFLAKVRLLNF